MKSFREFLNEINNVNENNNSDRDYIDNRLKTTFGKEGFKLPKNGPTVKIGYTLWPFTGGFEVINDGISIKVKKDGKELAYFDKPKLEYKKAVDFLIKSMKDLDEDEKLLSEKEKSYKDFFKEKLKKYSVESPAELSTEDKKKFFDEIDAEWEGKEELDEASEIVESKWEDMEEETEKLFDELLNLSKKGYVIRHSGTNGILIKSKSGAVAHLVFDPSNKF